ncbi:MAG: OmpA family protein [Chitinophagaceae bacterium]
MKLFVSVLLLFIYCGTAAQNLLVNMGFEEENICTEYKVNCAPEGWLTNDDVFFNYFKDANRAYDGVHCMAIEAGHANKPYKRTFIRSQLLCGLRKGNQYAISFFVKSPHLILDSIGVCVTYYDLLFERTPLQNIKPSFYLADARKDFKNDSSWQKVKFIYTANGNEAFVSIGNFSKRDITGSTNIEKENNFFVFIDDLSLLPMHPGEKLCDGWQLAREKIYDQDERHEFLRRKIRGGKANPRDTVKLAKNSVIIVDTLLLPDILFETGKAVLRTSSYLLLDSFSRKIMNSHVDSIIVEGHTDSTGSYAMNEQLSIDRALAVKKYLQDKTGHSSIITRGWAFLKPIAGNQTPEGRQRNRRVEVFLYIRE